MTEAEQIMKRCQAGTRNDKDYPAYKEELDALCQAKLQRTWVALTDEQIDACWNKTLWKEKQPHHIFAKAIEAKLKEVNT